MILADQMIYECLSMSSQKSEVPKEAHHHHPNQDQPHRKSGQAPKNSQAPNNQPHRKHFQDPEYDQHENHPHKQNQPVVYARKESMDVVLIVALVMSCSGGILHIIAVSTTHWSVATVHTLPSNSNSNLSIIATVHSLDKLSTMGEMEVIMSYGLWKTCTKIEEEGRLFSYICEWYSYVDHDKSNIRVVSIFGIVFPTLATLFGIICIMRDHSKHIIDINTMKCLLYMPYGLSVCGALATAVAIYIWGVKIHPNVRKTARNEHYFIDPEFGFSFYLSIAGSATMLAGGFLFYLDYKKRTKYCY